MLSKEDSMSIYYVAANGLDTNDGLSPETPWQTIKKVNQCVKTSDTVKFRRGDTFYGRIESPNGFKLYEDAYMEKDSHKRFTAPEVPTLYTTYGEGKKPVISQYKTAKKGVWEQVSEKIWSLDFSDGSRFTGSPDNTNGNVGFIKADGKIYGRKFFALDELQQQWDFFTSEDDNLTLYVYSEKNPDEISDSILFTFECSCFWISTGIEVENLVFTGCGGNCLHGVSRSAYIHDCEFHEIGGSRLDYHRIPNIRFGNGIEFWGYCRNITVERCLFSEIYDVAMTLQGPAVDAWENIHFIGNTVWNCTQALEIWAGNTPYDYEEPEGIVNCSFANNVCLDCGYGWAYDVRPNKDVAVALLMYRYTPKVCDFKIFGNTISNCRVATMYKGCGVGAYPDGYAVSGNTILKPQGQPLANREDAAEEAYEAFEQNILQNNNVYETATY